MDRSTELRSYEAEKGVYDAFMVSPIKNNPYHKDTVSWQRYETGFDYAQNILNLRKKLEKI